MCLTGVSVFPLEASLEEMIFSHPGGLMAESGTD
jgi:hypothetical protein